MDIKLATLYDRIKRGWTEEEAITIRIGGTKSGEHKWIDLAASNGIGRQTYHGRRRRGWTKEDAVSKPVQTEFNWRELG